KKLRNQVNILNPQPECFAAPQASTVKRQHQHPDGVRLKRSDRQVCGGFQQTADLFFAVNVWHEMFRDTRDRGGQWRFVDHAPGNREPVKTSKCGPLLFSIPSLGSAGEKECSNSLRIDHLDGRRLTGFAKPLQDRGGASELHPQRCTMLHILLYRLSDRHRRTPRSKSATAFNPVMSTFA